MRTASCALLVVLGACGDDGVSTGGGADGAGSEDSGGIAGASAGCGKTAAIDTGTWVQRSIDSGGPRELWVWLPDGYDPSRPYPVIYELHGCSGSPDRQDNNVPVEREIGADAIAVRGKAADQCWDTSPAGPDVPYFDAMLADVEGAFCVDTARRFVTGYSSGSFMAHTVGCIRGDKLRGVATIAGAGVGTSCTGDVAALLIHDADDTTVNFSEGEAARDRYLERNACATPPTSTPTDHPPCVAYDGCAAGKGVTWCPTAGKNHDRQDALAAPVFWDFISDNL